MITLKQVSKYYPGGIEALNAINFHLESGQMAFLTGHSGAGKSTLLRLIARLELPSAGDIIVNGTQFNQLTKKTLASYRRSLGLIFQLPYLLMDRNVFDNVALPLQIQSMHFNGLAKRVHAALDLVGLLKKENMLPSALSCGEQQRVGIARAIVHKPDLLIADEPTGNLDPALAAEIMALFKHFNEAGMSILIATHDLALIARMNHQILLLKKGRLC
ncbi:MAG: cell division ATP-binding protein FtsE [Legionella sp.]|nr:cell division ATP-binding protein FtsE [Legionella sp.]